MMEISNRHRIEDAFVVKTEAIDFFGMMVTDREGKSSVNGRVCFRDGTQWHFQSQKGDSAGLKQSLISLSEAISALYGTQVFRLNLQHPIAFEEFIHLMRAAKRRMGYA
jgi:hypothetical protein